MRPPEFTGGNTGGEFALSRSWVGIRASMRPPEFTGGNADGKDSGSSDGKQLDASMRPPEFTGGNAPSIQSTEADRPLHWGFNEAAGIHRRKLAFEPSINPVLALRAASMRPPEFTGGNTIARALLSRRQLRQHNRFNEAAGIHRRKRTSAATGEPSVVAPLASMRPPEFTGGNSGTR